MTITPTVGRVVWYNPSPAELNGEPGQPGYQPCAAIIAHVWNDKMVNLMIVDRSGFSQGRTSVELWQGEGDRPRGHAYAEWMPYQKGQAAKTEATEAKVADLVRAEAAVKPKGKGNAGSS